jgi:predicted transcriptional regulator
MTVTIGIINQNSPLQLMPSGLVFTPMNPQQAIQKLSRHGLSQQAIADMVDVKQSTISKISAGLRQPRYELGAKLVKMAEGIELLQLDRGKK